jgi:hypothetical protein
MYQEKSGNPVPGIVESRDQGGQIWRIFAQWVKVYLGKFWANYSRGPNYQTTFFHGKSVCIYFDQKWAWLRLGDCFIQLIWSLCKA